MLNLWYYVCYGCNSTPKRMYCEVVNVNYKEMYLKMVRASEDAIRTLIKAQQECEEMYLDAAEPDPDTEESR